jgi:hypothetical protein
VTALNLLIEHNPTMKRSLLSLAALSAAALALTPATSQAHDRHFAYSYETTTMPKGMWEFEPWVTFKHYDNKDVYDFRYELEYGVTDRLQLGAYLSDWRYTDSEDGESEAEWKTAGLEAIYSLSNPNTDWIGSALYGEVLIGPEKFALEGKLLLQKNFGPLSVVYNAIVEAEWEGENYDERVGVWENTFGIVYNFSPSFAAGFEALHEIEFEDWSEAGDHVFYIGPNVSYHAKNFYATVAGLFDVSDVDGEAEAQVRLLLGFSF